MDICTTPPPPSIIDEPSNVIESRPFGKIQNKFHFRMFLFIHSIFPVPDPPAPTWSSAKAAVIKKHKASVSTIRTHIELSTC